MIEHLLRNFPPHLHQSVPKHSANNVRRSMEGSCVSISAVKLHFEVCPQVLNQVHIWGIWRPFHHPKSMFNHCCIQDSKKALVVLDIWGRALSCWNVIPDMPSLASASRYGRRLLRRMSIYTSLLTVPSMNAIGPSLLPAKHPHIICEISPSLVLPRTFLGAYFSSFVWCRKTQTCWRAESF